jgi:hypothetical protein
VLIRLDLLDVDPPVAVLLFHGHERDDIEAVVGQSKAIPDGYLACGLARLDDLRINELHRNVVLNEPESSGLSDLGFRATRKAIHETFEILCIGSIHGISQAISDVSFRGIARRHPKPGLSSGGRYVGGRVGFRDRDPGPRGK